MSHASSRQNRPSPVPEATGLPPRITRPLNAAAAALALFLLVFGIWSAQGRFATTLHVPGSIGSTATSQPIQHQFGGKLSEVHVQMHQPVTKGDVLFRMDTADLDLQIAALEHRRDFLRAELLEIGQRLEAGPFVETPATTPAQVLLAYAVQDDALQVEMADLVEKARAAKEQEQQLSREITYLQQLHAILSTQSDRVATLANKGLATDQALESAQQRALELAARIAERESERAELREHAAGNARSAQLLKSRHEQDLATRQLMQSRELTAITGEHARLVLQRNEATLTAPVSGSVVSLEFPAAGATVPRGVTLAVIAQPLGDPHADLHVPPVYIDQVSVGQTGILTIPGLPQRNMPRIDVTVSGVAETPVRDPDGNALYYVARIGIDPGALKAAEARLGARFHLVAGMPVSAALNGAQTSLWHYLAAPLVDTLRMGFEE